MYDGLVEICEQVDADASVRALVLTGAGGKAFAAGTDIGQFRAFKTPQDAIDYEERIDARAGRAGSLPRADHRGASPAPAPAAARRSPPAATCASRAKTRAIRLSDRETLGNCLSMANSPASLR